MCLRLHRLGWALAGLAALTAACTQTSDNSVANAEPVATVRSALGPCSADVQGIGDAYAGWIALKDDGSVWMNRPGGGAGASTLAMKVEQLANEVDSIADVDGESLTFCAVKTDHTLWCWGANSHGQVGDGSGEPDVNQPTQVPIPGDNVASVATGGEHACAVTVDGRLFCWGMNEFGQVGRRAGQRNWGCPHPHRSDLPRGPSGRGIRGLRTYLRADERRFPALLGTQRLRRNRRRHLAGARLRGRGQAFADPRFVARNGRGDGVGRAGSSPASSRRAMRASGAGETTPRVIWRPGTPRTRQSRRRR